jgi:hypothetical protein
MRNKDYSINPFRCGASNNLKQLDQLDLWNKITWLEMWNSMYNQKDM